MNFAPTSPAIELLVITHHSAYSSFVVWIANVVDIVKYRMILKKFQKAYHTLLLLLDLLKNKLPFKLFGIYHGSIAWNSIMLRSSGHWNRYDLIMVINQCHFILIKSFSKLFLMLDLVHFILHPNQSHDTRYQIQSFAHFTCYILNQTLPKHPLPYRKKNVKIQRWPQYLLIELISNLWHNCK